MPCYTVQTTSLDLSQVRDMTILKAALAVLGAQNVQETTSGLSFRDGEGWYGRYVSGTKTVEIDGASRMAEPGVIARAYAGEVVTAAARKFGWQVAPKGENKFQMKRRGM